ncbi:Uncharacterized protein TCM_025667 [Theobroma cacao]|uniref:Uncharacterized protein n=1 Tax=Theobroma cacao TaxID=3641 RepID=A0A061F718_THECC|nr:Uncharacterized protein TCM_025667 [Theobroma cacao]
MGTPLVRRLKETLLKLIILSFCLLRRLKSWILYTAPLLPGRRRRSDRNNRKKMARLICLVAIEKTEVLMNDGVCL